MRFLRSFGLPLCGLAAWLSTDCVVALSPPPAKPNIVLILTDDMAFGDIGFNGQKEYATPNLDRLASEGKVFTNGYAGAPVCASSRAALLTGLHTGHARVRALGTRKPGQEALLLKQDVTIAEVLKQAGYRTGIVGKWGLGSSNDEGHPLEQGFDFFFGFETHQQAHDYFPPFLTRGRERVDLPENAGFDMKRIYRYDSDRARPQVAKDFWPRYLPDGRLDLADLGIVDPARARYSQDLVQEAALQFIGDSAGKPFFLLYATQLPHGPVITKDLEDFKDKPWPQKHKVWAAMQTTLDRHVGQLCEELKKRGLDRETLIVFTSDNGVEPGYLAARFDREQRGDDPVFHNAGPGRGMKYSHYERGLHVPLVFHAPGWIPAGKITQVAANYDFLATFAALAGTPAPPNDGMNLTPVLTATADVPSHADRLLYWEDGANAKGTQAARTGPWFAIRTAPDQPMELYQLEQDVECRKNLAAEQPDVVATIRRWMDSSHTPSEWYPSALDAAKQQ